MNLNIIKLIQEHTNIEFAEVDDGVVYKLPSGEIIKEEFLIYNKLRKPDYIYRLVEQTCGGICSIGNPADKCILNGIYSNSKCSVYSLEDINDIKIDFNTLNNILEDYEVSQV